MSIAVTDDRVVEGLDADGDPIYPICYLPDRQDFLTIGRVVRVHLTTV